VARISIIGAGVVGCATAWALSGRGADVTLVEQFEPGHAAGSSHGRTRIVRLAYPDLAWVALAEEALEGWRALERDSEQALLGMYGLVELCASVELTSRDVLAARGIDHRLLDERELRVLGVTQLCGRRTPGSSTPIGHSTPCSRLHARGAFGWRPAAAWSRSTRSTPTSSS
jgi:glycine/D-amino acid oxidase-like deaminating enzyme